MIVVDTNVASELMRRAPDAGVVRWVRSARPDDLWTTAVTVAEILVGLARLPVGRRRDTLHRAVREVFRAFDDRVLGFDAAAADHYAEIVVARERSGAPIAGFDAQVAAIARRHGATVATRNTRDFVGTGVELVDPWGDG